MPTLCLQFLRLLALAFVALGLLSPWFQLPVADAGGEMVAWQPASVFAFKAVTILGLGAGVIAALVQGLRQPGAAVRGYVKVWSCRRPVVIASASLAAALLFFPFTTMVWTPGAGARATELAVAHDTLTWLGGDIYNAQEYEAVPNKGAELLKSAPRAIEITPAPVALPAALGLGKLDEFAEWCGYTPAFSEFVKKGWVCTLIGLLLLTLSLLRVGFFASRRKGDYRIARGAGKAFAISAAAGGLVVLTCVHQSAKALDRARSASAERQPMRALAALDSARLWFPALAYSTDLVVQRGELSTRSGAEPDAYAELRMALELERSGFEARAESAFRTLLADPELPPPLRAETRRALLRFAVHDLNSGQGTRALATLDSLHADDPTSPRLNYMLQIANLRLARCDALAANAAEMATIYSFFQSPNKRSALASAQRHLAIAALERGDAVAAAFHNSKSRRP